MVGKPGCRETVKRQVRQDPDGKVKAGLPEPQCPNRNHSGREGRLASSTHGDALSRGLKTSPGAYPIPQRDEKREE